MKGEPQGLQGKNLENFKLYLLVLRIFNAVLTIFPQIGLKKIAEKNSVFVAQNSTFVAVFSVLNTARAENDKA